MRDLIDRTIDRYARWLLAYAGRAVVWSLTRLARHYAIPRDLVLKTAATMVRRLEADISAMCSYQKSEAQILSERLGRRYDPGMALNEATERALTLKAEAATRAFMASPPSPRLAAAVERGDVQSGTVRIKLDGSDDSWVKLAAQQRANPDPMIDNHPTLTKEQLAALEVQKRSARQLVERSAPKGDHSL